MHAERPPQVVIVKKRQEKKMEYTTEQIEEANAALDQAKQLVLNGGEAEAVNKLIDRAKEILGDPIGPGRPSE